MSSPLDVPRGGKQKVCPPPQMEPSASLQDTPTVEFRSHPDAENPPPIDARLSPTSPVDPVAVAVPSSLLADVLPELANHSRYRIVGMLGKGGMGIVYKAEHQVMKRTVALKVIGTHLVANSAALERFRREVEAAARLSHPNIVTAYDAEQAGSCHFLVMELVDGISFDLLLKRKGPLPLVFACEYIRQAALGLQHAHEHGMVHRDIKLQNLMLTRKGQVKILDFGLARFASENSPSASITEYGVLTGTPDFMSPEQAEDAHSADIRADIYSLGCTFYTLLTGQLPFPGGNYAEKLIAHLKKEPAALTDFRSDLPPELILLVGRMMAKDPAQRFQTPDEVAKTLLAFRKAGAGAIEPAPVVRSQEASVPNRKPISEPPPDATEICDAADDIEDPSPPRRMESRNNSVRQRNHPPARRDRRYVVAGAVFGMLGLLALGGLLLLALARVGTHGKKADASVPSPSTGQREEAQGQVSVTSLDPNLQVAIRHGSKVFGTIGPGSKPDLTLPAGDYEVQIVAGAPELRGFTARLFLARGDRKVVDVRREGVFVRDSSAAPLLPPGPPGGPPPPPFGRPPRR